MTRPTQYCYVNTTLACIIGVDFGESTPVACTIQHKRSVAYCIALCTL